MMSKTQDGIGCRKATMRYTDGGRTKQFSLLIIFRLIIFTLLKEYHNRNDISVVHNKISVNDHLPVKGTEIEQNGPYLWLRLMYFPKLNAGSFG